MKLGDIAAKVQENVKASQAAQAEAVAAATAPWTGPKWEYKVEILTTMVGRDKVRLTDLQATMKAHGDAGWELCDIEIDANLKGSRDGHLMIFKRPAA